MFKLWLIDHNGEFQATVYAETRALAGLKAREWITKRDGHDCTIFRKTEAGTWADDGVRALRAALLTA